MSTPSANVETEIVPPRHERGPCRVKLSKGSTRGDAVNVSLDGEIRYEEFSTGHDRAIERVISAIGAR